jgi:hypothetical protein
MKIEMGRRRYYLISLLLVLLALGMRFAAMGIHSRGVGIRASAISSPADQREAMYEQADRLSARGTAVGVVSLFTALASSICLYVSFRRREQVQSRLFPLALLLCYAGSLFILV